MSTDDRLFFQQSWEHLMGSLDKMLDDVRSNAAMLRHSDAAVENLLAEAEQKRSAAEAALQELAARRSELSGTLDEMQRLLAVSGVPLRGEIT